MGRRLHLQRPSRAAGRAAQQVRRPPARRRQQMEQVTAQGGTLVQRSQAPAQWQVANAKPRQQQRCQVIQRNRSDQPLTLTRKTQPSQRPPSAEAKVQRRRSSLRLSQQQQRGQLGVQCSRRMGQSQTATRAQRSWHRMQQKGSAASWKKCACHVIWRCWRLWKSCRHSHCPVATLQHQFAYSGAHSSRQHSIRDTPGALVHSIAGAGATNTRNTAAGSWQWRQTRRQGCA